MVETIITGIFPDFIRADLLRNTPNDLPSLIITLKTYRKRRHDGPVPIHFKKTRAKCRPK